MPLTLNKKINNNNLFLNHKFKDYVVCCWAVCVCGGGGVCVCVCVCVCACMCVCVRMSVVGFLFFVGGGKGGCFNVKLMGFFVYRWGC